MDGCCDLREVGETEIPHREGRERPVLRGEVDERRGRESREAVPRMPRVNLHEAAGVAILQRREQQRLDDGESRRAGADAETPA